jgi:hypothetical protein
MKFLQKRFQDKKLLLYSNKERNEFAIKTGSETDFRVRSSDIATYNEIVDKMNLSVFQDLTPIQILGLWKSWIYNIREKDYKFLKGLNILQFIEENEKVELVTEKTFYKGHSHVPLYDKVIVTNKRIIIFKAHTAGFKTNWEPLSILFKDINSIELSNGFFSIFSFDIYVQTSESFKINAIKKSVAKTIVDYVNQCIKEE